MAKEIIILDVLRGPGGDRSIRCALWFPIPLARRVPKPGATSIFRNALAAEITDLQTGAVIEEVYDFQVPGATTAAQIKTFLEAKWSARNTEISNLPDPNQFYGIFWDGTVWSA